MPLPGFKMIPDGWSADHAAVLPGSFNAKVKIEAATSTSVWDPATDDTTTTYAVLWPASGEPTGARVQRLVGDRSLDLAGESLTGQPYLVEVDAACPVIARGSRVTIAEMPNDPSAVGQTLYVIVAPFGSERFTRSLFCSDIEQDARPSGGGS